jgi:hypothetical protein
MTTIAVTSRTLATRPPGITAGKRRFSDFFAAAVQSKKHGKNGRFSNGE